MLICTTTIVVYVDAVIAAFLTLLLGLSESFGICLVMGKITAQPKVSVFPLTPTRHIRRTEETTEKHCSLSKGLIVLDLYQASKCCLTITNFPTECEVPM